MALVRAGFGCVAMVYELEPPTRVVVQKLFELLINKLRGNINDDDDGSEGDRPSYPQLEQLMSKYARDGFRKSFGVEYNGTQTVLPDSEPHGSVQSFESAFTYPGLSVTVANIEACMDNTIVRRDEGRFPPFAQGVIYDDIRNRILRSSNGQYDVNTWYHAKLKNFFWDPEAAANRDIQQFACYILAHGDLKIGIHGEGLRLFVFYLGHLGAVHNVNTTTLIWRPRSTPNIHILNIYELRPWKCGPRAVGLSSAQVSQAVKSRRNAAGHPDEAPPPSRRVPMRRAHPQKRWWRVAL
ncbi:hypothetical protein P691DRAFT_788317 [Macrolepiota fuliginosa MF-IS2]|uniref:Uncharacterized protein n=1 Tax=Macrolepiota fuliginosa MF-IS2 TaxID=1400762 RepID=A0A9P5X3Z7_9AGAR|nr:hypothetical protein P691DRAFT_788317 [Macrolepiota fuliginosa MF-IS2]